MSMLSTYPNEAAASNHYAGWSSKALRNEWRTPEWLFCALTDRFGPFTLDAAANKYNTKCTKFNSGDAPDRHKWEGRVFCNPPYSGTPRIARWVEKAFEAACEGATCILIVPAQINSRWFHTHGKRARLIIPKGRIDFAPPPGLKASRAMHESMILVFDSLSVRGKQNTVSAECWDIKASG